jgi:hypothetical protein
MNGHELQVGVEVFQSFGRGCKLGSENFYEEMRSSENFPITGLVDNIEPVIVYKL